MSNMEGVTILAESSGMPLGLRIFLIALTVAFYAVFVIMVVFAFKDSDTSWVYVGAPSLIIAICLTIMISSAFYKDSHKTYKVIIDDNISFNDFIEKYEIVDQDGQIYEVRERNGNEQNN